MTIPSERRYWPPRPDPAVEAAGGQHHLEHPDDFWEIVLGSGYRATVNAISPAQGDRLRADLLAELRSREITTVQTDVIYGTATRPLLVPPSGS